jgi:hypothetical protein
LNSPAYLFTLADFIHKGRVASHEEYRNDGMLVVIDNYPELTEFVAKNKVVFISHQWIAWSEPDPDGIQYKYMAEACQAVAKKEGVDPKQMFIFVDYTSIPQKNVRQRVNAISTLGVYAALFDYFIVIAPPAVHKNTSKAINMSSYQKRGWCRLEQWGHMCSHGMKNMFSWDGKTLTALDEGDNVNWFLDSIMVLDGDYTEDSDREVMVDIILGLYAMVLTRQKGGDNKGGTDMLSQLISENYDKVFPRDHFVDYPKILATLVDERLPEPTKGFAKQPPVGYDDDTLCKASKDEKVIDIKQADV